MASWKRTALNGGGSNGQDSYPLLPWQSSPCDARQKRAGPTRRPKRSSGLTAGSSGDTGDVNGTHAYKPTALSGLTSTSKDQTTSRCWCARKSSPGVDRRPCHRGSGCTTRDPGQPGVRLRCYLEVRLVDRDARGTRPGRLPGRGLLTEDRP
ncbi:DUF6207 family protein [Streptomyces sp. NPDC058620]|uniref:DUF6207 family protein n=1 Tax=Streptomyces sp. NPDC058620 TaxID=3346560 RepID=UPI0036550FB1